MHEKRLSVQGKRGPVQGKRGPMQEKEVTCREKGYYAGKTAGHCQSSTVAIDIGWHVIGINSAL